MDHEEQALKNYDEAVERYTAICQLWEMEGKPLLATGSTGQLVEHPLVKMMREHEILVQKLSATLRKTHRGPVPSAVIPPSPAAKIRAKK